MGNADGEGDEKNVHEVILSSYEIGKYEVTISEYISFLNNIGAVNVHGSWVKFYDENCPIKYKDGKYHIKEWQDIYGNTIDISDYPMICVSWTGAKEYCNWLSAQNNLQKCYGSSMSIDITKNGFHLPTEAQWEFAAKGGNLSHNYKFSGGNNIDEVGWHRNNSDTIGSYKISYYNGGGPLNVGRKKPNELGIFDMTGNVDEWCDDWYYYSYPTENSKDPIGKFYASATEKVTRGGNYSTHEVWSYYSNRSSPEAITFSDGIGFRVAK
jgi:formylglycine-generating enzyme